MAKAVKKSGCKKGIAVKKVGKKIAKKTAVKKNVSEKSENRYQVFRQIR